MIKFFRLITSTLMNLSVLLVVLAQRLCIHDPVKQSAIGITFFTCRHCGYQVKMVK